MSSIALKVRIMENPQAINLTLRLLVPFRSLNPVNLAEISHHAPQSAKQIIIVVDDEAQVTRPITDGM